MEKKLQGIIAPLITPFDADYQVDYALLKKEIKILADAGVDAISPGGSTGDGAALTDEDLGNMIRTIQEVAPGMTIVAGIIRNSTRQALSAAAAARDAGADALMVTPLSYGPMVPDDEGNLNYYRILSDAIKLPIVIYNVVEPNTISYQLMDRLLDIEYVVGVKQARNGIMAMYEMKQRIGHKGLVFAATDEMIYSCFDLGADGAISAILTAFPELCVKMWKLAKEGKHQEGLALQARLYPVWMAIIGNQFSIRIKYALSLMGREPGLPCSPICHISEDEKASIREAMKMASLIH